MTSFSDELIFEALTPPAFRVRVARAHWGLIVAVKHPVMTGHEKEVEETLQHPSEIRQSRSDATVYLFYRPKRLGRFSLRGRKAIKRQRFF